MLLLRFQYVFHSCNSTSVLHQLTEGHLSLVYAQSLALTHFVQQSKHRVPFLWIPPQPTGPVFQLQRSPKAQNLREESPSVWMNAKAVGICQSSPSCSNLLCVGTHGHP